MLFRNHFVSHGPKALALFLDPKVLLLVSQGQQEQIEVVSNVSFHNLHILNSFGCYLNLMVKLLFKDVDHNQVVVESWESNEWPVYAISCEVGVHVLIDLNVFAGEFFVLVLLVCVFCLLILFLFKDSLVENEFIISHAVNSNCLYSEPFLLFWGTMAVSVSTMPMSMPMTL